jgi:hypothetical protein
MFECRAYYTISEKSFGSQWPSSDCLKLHVRFFLSPGCLAFLSNSPDVFAKKPTLL